MSTTTKSSSTYPPTRTLLFGIWRHLSLNRRIQLGLLLLVMLASGVAELVSLGAVLPFLAVLSDPESLMQQSLVKAFAIRMGLTTPNQLLLPVTLIFASTAVVAALTRLFNLWLNLRLAAAVGSDLSCEAYRLTLYQPYSVHLQRNTAEIITGVTDQIRITVLSLNAFLQLITSCVVVLSLLAGLMLIDAPVALTAMALFIAAYGALSITVRSDLQTNSLLIARAYSRQVKALQEGLGAIRDILLDGTQSTYLQIYQQTDRSQRKLQAKNSFLGAFPRYALEALGIVVIALFGYSLVLHQGAGAFVLPRLGALALGAQRLLPAMQQVYGGWASLKGSNAAIQSVLSMLNQSAPLTITAAKASSLFNTLRFDKVQFCYSPGQPEVLQELNLEIRRGESVGIIGSTGSGKSTTIDLIMGLLVPTSGLVLVDGCDLHDSKHPERLISWRSKIAHVPQNIYLADSSIAENIAFGVPLQDIDFSRVKQAAQKAQISSFIESSSNGYESFVGERGIRLSGGQRQRIGIARALYRTPKILLFDEATSALDNLTEKAVISSITSLGKSITLVMIAHRLSTLSNCDRVICLEKGKLVSDGPPSVVLGSN